MKALITLGRRLANKAEGMGFSPAVFRNCNSIAVFGRNPSRRSGLTHSGQCQSLPVISGRGGKAPGQKRDNFWDACRALVALGIPCFFLAAALGPGGGDQVDPLLQPRPVRRPRRSAADRGLPGDSDLMQLAEAYLAQQRSHWPDLAKCGLLPATTHSTLCAMIEDFKDRHRGKKPDMTAIDKRLSKSVSLAGIYSRYSCDGSESTSIIDQMNNCLARARKEDLFIPWAYIYADYSRSGLDPSRRGYASYKAVLSDTESRISVTFVDDFTRASRDEMQWWYLAALCKKLRKNLIGASDGFNLSDPDSDIKITVFALVSRLFIKNVQQKVMRGMKGTVGRQGCLGKLALGLTRRQKIDDNGRPILRADGRPRHEPAIDPNTKDSVSLLFNLYTVEKLSTYKIMKHFNMLRVEDWDGWSERTIKDMLANPIYIGVRIWNQTRQEFDFESQKWVTLNNPIEEWIFDYMPEVAIVPLDQWSAAQDRMAAARKASPLTGRKLSRNQKSATTLFSGTLFCSSCGHELLLNRSAGKYKSTYCPNGPRKAHGCELSTSKSATIVESCLLEYLCSALLTEEAVNELVSRANQFLADEGRRPKQDTRALKASARSLDTKIAKLVRLVEDEPNEDVCRGYHRRIVELQQQLNSLQVDIREMELKNASPPKPIDRDRALQLLTDIRGLLHEGGIPAAAEAIRDLTGPIKIHQEPDPGGKGMRWVATFTPNLPKILARFANQRDYPDSVTLEFLCARNWIVPAPVAVTIAQDPPPYEALGPTIKAMRDAGAAMKTIAAKLQITELLVQNSLKFMATGERPKWPKKDRAHRKGGKPQETKYKELSAEVVRLRDSELMSFPKIGKELGCSESIARRAYDYGRPDVVDRAIESGKPINRGKYSHLLRSAP